MFSEQANKPLSSSGEVYSQAFWLALTSPAQSLRKKVGLELPGQQFSVRTVVQPHSKLE